MYGAYMFFVDLPMRMILVTFWTLICTYVWISTDELIDMMNDWNRSTSTVNLWVIIVIFGWL